MKKIISIILTAAIVTCMSLNVFAYDSGTYKTNYDWMNTRSGPGLGYAVTGQLPRNSQVNIVQVDENWGKMENDSWIRLDSGFTSFIGDENGNSSMYNTGTYSVLYNGTNLRSGPGLGYSVVGSANSGTTLTVVEVSGEWGKINNGSWIRLNGFARYIGASPSNNNSSTTSQIRNHVEVIVDKALSHVGYLETTYSNGGFWSKYGAWYGQQVGNSSFAYAPWCAAFVSYFSSEADVDRNTIPLFSSCSVGVNWFKNNGSLHSRIGYTPKRGDIIFFTSNGYSPYHVGIVENVSGGKVYTVEGNVHDGSGNNYGVRKLSYNISSSKILGYGSPNYK